MATNPFELLVRGRAGDACVVTHDRTWSYGDVAARAAAFAGALTTTGAGPGDIVAVQVAKSVDAVALYLACLRLGLVHLPLNTAYTPAEVDVFVADAEPAVVVQDPTAAVERAGTTTLTLGADGTGSLVDLADRADPRIDLVPRAPHDPAAMLYTSGTTGRSKGAVLSVENLVANARALVAAWGFTADDVLVHTLPIFHVHGLFVALHCAFAVGAEVRFHEHFDVDAVLDELPTATALMGVPTHYHRLLASPRLDRPTTSAMRLFTSGSAPLPAAEHDAFAARTGHRIVERYGMTETMILTSNPLDGERVAGTVGFPLPGVEVRICVDDEVAGRDVVGDVEVRTPGLFLGYHRLPDKTAASFHDDWFRTGDVGSVDGEGRLTLTGRATDMILTGGLNVYPKEIEAALCTLDAVDAAAVIGAPDPDFGESIVAVVQLRPGASSPTLDDARRACADLARFKHPRRLEVVDELPRNAMGKITKSALRDRFA